MKRYRITKISKRDAHYDFRKSLLKKLVYGKLVSQPKNVWSSFMGFLEEDADEYAEKGFSLVLFEAQLEEVQ